MKLSTSTDSNDSSCFKISERTFRFSGNMICIILSFLFFNQSSAQSRSWEVVTWNGSLQGYRYLPPNYDSRTEWPVIIFFSGAGERNGSGGCSSVSCLLNTGLPEWINDGNDLEAIVFCPQISTSSSTWTNTLMLAAKNYIFNNANVDPNKVYVTGLSLGATGAELFTKTYPSTVAATINISGSYNVTGSVNSKDVPRYFVHGNSDNIQNISSSLTLIDSLNKLSPKPVLPPLTSFHWGLGHSSSVWDGKVYNDFYPWWRWLNLHDKDADTTALNYVNSLEVSSNWNFYWRTVRLVNSLPSSTHKTNLLSRLDGVKNIIYPVGSRRVLMDLGLTTYQSSGYVNNLTDLSSTASPYTNLIDDDGNNTGFGFDQVSENANPEEGDVGIVNSYFAGLDEENGFRDSWIVFGNGGTSRLTGLDTAKTYTIRISGASKTTSVTEQSGFRVTINSFEKSVDFQRYNTTKYIEFTGISPNGSGNIDMTVRSYATTNQWLGYIAFIELVEEAEGNLSPVANAGSDQILNLPDNDAILDGSATDDESIVSHTWSFISGPTTPFISDPSDYDTEITGLDSTGTYIFRLSVTDNDGATDTDDMVITVNSQSLPEVQRVINVNIYGGTNAYNNQSWNDWNISSSLNSGLLNYSDGTISAVTAEFNISSSIADNGSSYGSGMAPAEVLRYTAYSTVARTLSFENLNDSNTYKLHLFGSRLNSSNTVQYIIGSDTVSVLVTNNLTNEAVFDGLVPVNGTLDLQIRVAPGSTFSYINGFSLVEIGDSLNSAPISNAGPDQVITLPLNEVLLIGSGTESDPGDSIISFEWNYVSGPSAYTIEDPYNDTTSITGLEAGVYIFSLTVTDNENASDIDSITITVNNVLPAGDTINVNVYSGSNPYNNSSWNDWNIGSSMGSDLNSGNLDYSNIVASSIGATLSFSQAIADNGTSFGGVMCPPEVLRYTSYATSNRSLTITGLDPLATYDIQLYAGRNGTGNSTIFTVNSTSDTIITDQNTSETADFYGLVADNNNEIIISISSGSTFNYLNGFRIVEYTAQGRRTSWVTAGSTQPIKAVQLFPNPAKKMIGVSMGDRISGNFRYDILDISGRIIKRGTIQMLNGRRYFSIDINTLTPGQYILRLNDEGGKVYVEKFIKI